MTFSFNLNSLNSKRTSKDLLLRKRTLTLRMITSLRKGMTTVLILILNHQMADHLAPIQVLILGTKKGDPRAEAGKEVAAGAKEDGDGTSKTSNLARTCLTPIWDQTLCLSPLSSRCLNSSHGETTSHPRTLNLITWCPF